MQPVSLHWTEFPEHAAGFAALDRNLPSLFRSVMQSTTHITLRFRAKAVTRLHNQCSHDETHDLLFR